MYGSKWASWLLQSKPDCVCFRITKKICMNIFIPVLRWALSLVISKIKIKVLKFCVHCIEIHWRSQAMEWDFDWLCLYKFHIMNQPIEKPHKSQKLCNLKDCWFYINVAYIIFHPHWNTPHQLATSLVLPIKLRLLNSSNAFEAATIILKQSQSPIEWLLCWVIIHVYWPSIGSMLS